MSRRTATRGFTLVELLVSMTVLVVLALGIGMILQESQKVVSVTQASMRSNSAASAIAGVLRADVQRISKNAFLYIQRDDTNGDRLMFTTAGPSTALDGSIGTGQIISIGLTENATSNSIVPGDYKVFYRQAFTLADAPGSWSVSTDKLGISFSQIQAGTTTELGTIGSDVLDLAPINLAVPPQTTGEVVDLWQALAPGCTALEIRWTDGTTDGTTGNLNWYPGSDGNKFWTKFDQSNWPKAIRIRFRLVDELFNAAGTSTDGKNYEIICPTGQ